MPRLAINGGEPLRTKPFPKWPQVDERDEQAVGDVVRNGTWWMYSYGAGELAGTAEGSSRVEAFEKAFAESVHAPRAIATSSGSGCLEIACRAIGLKPGDEVITTPYTFIATSTCILNAYAVPVFVDIEPDTYNIDPDCVEAAITERTKAIIPVHFGGNICDMTRLRQIAKKHNLKIIEDAAHAHGASLTGDRWAGTLGDIGIFSLQQSKLLTCGEGGVITTADPDLADLSWSLRHYGRTKTGPWYEHVRLGWHYRMTEMQGALGLSQLGKMPAQNETRRKNARTLFAALEDVPGVTPCVQNPESDHDVYYLVLLRYDSAAWDDVPRDKVVDALIAEGIPCLAGYSFPLYANPLFRNLDFNGADSPYKTGHTKPIDYGKYRELCPVVERVCSQESIWLTQDLLLGTEEDTLDIARAFAKVHGNRKELGT